MMGGMNRVIRFTSDSAALEKLLRLFQFISTIIALTTTSPQTIKTFLLLRSQLALGRRYFRIFRFISCFAQALSVLSGVDGSEVMRNVLEVGKHSFMGIYLGMESLSILHVMDVYPTPEFARTCQVEGNKFWFYSLLCSIILHLRFLFTPDVPPPVPPKTRTTSPKRSTVEKVRESQVGQRKRNYERTLVVRRLVADSCDLLVPGLVVGWIETSLLVTGYAGAMSSFLGLWEIWGKLG